jgi:hypothetical protein
MGGEDDSVFGEDLAPFSCALDQVSKGRLLENEAYFKEKYGI